MLDGAADDAGPIECLEFSLGDDADLFDRFGVTQRVKNIPERILGLTQDTVDIRTNPPADNVLAFVAARRQAQNLNDRLRRRRIGEGCLLRNFNSHLVASSPSLQTSCPLRL